MSKYYAQFSIKESGERKTVKLPLCKTIKQLEQKINVLIEWKNYMPKEITVMSLKKDKVGIHGFYNWTDGKLRLDKSKPVMIHNALYGLDN